MPENYRKYLRTGLQRLGLVVEDEELLLERLLVYLAELQKWNRKINLIARGTEELRILENHFLDSLTLLPYARPDRDHPHPTLLDVGSGAGFPGLVLKAASPALAVTLVEPRQKRAFFLQHMIRTLGLSRIEVVQEHLEPEPNRDRDRGTFQDRRFRFITSRGLTEIRPFLTMVAPFLEPDGRVLCMKGPAGETEAAATAGADHGLSLLASSSLHLPYSGAERLIFIFGASNGAGEGIAKNAKK